MCSSLAGHFHALFHIPYIEEPNLRKTLITTAALEKMNTNAYTLNKCDRSVVHVPDGIAAWLGGHQLSSTSTSKVDLLLLPGDGGRMDLTGHTVLVVDSSTPAVVIGHDARTRIDADTDTPDPSPLSSMPPGAAQLVLDMLELKIIEAARNGAPPSYIKGLRLVA